LRNFHNLNPGFDTRNILLFGINPAIAGYKDLQASQLYRNLRQRFAALPGVLSASYSEDPLLSGGMSGHSFHLDGAAPKSNIDCNTLAVGPDFFATLRIPVLAGRAFMPADFASADATRAAQAPSTPSSTPAVANTSQPQPAPAPVIVNEMFARKFFPQQDPVGKHIGEPQGDEPVTGPQPGYLIVGIVGDTKYESLRHEIQAMMFLPLVGSTAHFELRTAADPTAPIKLVRGIIANADNNLPVVDALTQSEQIDRLLFQVRLMSRLSSFFGALSLVLACIGLYGLLSYEVARRTRELGIRMALGAQQRDLLRLVVGQGIPLALVGAAVGIGAAIGVTRFMASMLYAVHANDPATIAAIAILLALVALAACYIPARRAMQVDPMVALRYE
jgi:predicted permease